MHAISPGNNPGPDDRYRDFSINVPEFYNFGYDVIDARAVKEPDKPAMLWVDQQGQEKRFTFGDIKIESDRAVQVLSTSGISKGDRVFIMLPRIPEWWILIVALIKLGAIYTPAPTLLTPHDISYRLKIGGFALVITDLENAHKVQVAVRERSFKTSEKFRDVEFERKKKQYLYNDGAVYNFMDMETYETFETPLPTEEDVKSKLAEGVEIEYWDMMGKKKIVRTKG
jgi:acyl-coenzyme A synthetase/AMP-(fatty) acid ligase